MVRQRSALCLCGAFLLAGSSTSAQTSAEERFHLQETTIAGIHRAIQSRQITCKGLVQLYLDRAKAYNGVCTQLVTADGGPIPAATGPVRAGSPLTFPTSTFPASSMLPNLDQYFGPPIEYGRMEPTISDPTVQQQYGSVVGMPDAGQLNALETLNIRGERSVTCKAACDLHPSSGSLPSSCPSACEAFRKLPDALERAAELDQQFGSTPDLASLPLYCIPFSFKNWYYAKDMRGTGGNDVNFAMDVPPFDASIVAAVREKGAIVYAIANASQAGGGVAGSVAATKVFFGGGPGGGLTHSTWGGQSCDPYDTEREPGGTSGGSGASVSANLVTCSICETTSGSCRWPAYAGNVVNLVTTKGVLADGGMSSQYINHRPGITCRTLQDAAYVLDAIKGYNPRDMYSAIPKAFIPKEPYASFLVGEVSGEGSERKPLQGMRIGVVREFFVKLTPNDAAISDLIDKEIKSILRDKLGAEIVESVDPLYPDDPDIPNMKYSFRDALAQIVPIHAPEYFYQTTREGELEFAVPGHDVKTKDYLVKLALGQAPLSEKLNLRRLTSGLSNPRDAQFTFSKYLLERGDERVKDWASFVANSKWYSDAGRAAAENAVNLQDLRAPSGVDRIKMRFLARLVVNKVMYENNLDVLVHPNATIPPNKIGFGREPEINSRPFQGVPITDLLGVPEIVVPAGYNEIVYEPQYVLSEDRKRYNVVSGSVRLTVRHPLPISILFWAGPGEEPKVIKVASAYEVATKHRVPPSAFGPLSGEP
ncbi:MAG: amidase [Acidobacteria bacterium]|nr:amidase [Acidobacteriota bacterium]